MRDLNLYHSMIIKEHKRMTFGLARSVRLGFVFLGISMASPALAAAEDPVVATLNGTEIHQSEVQAIRATLPAQIQGLSEDEVTRRLIDRMITVKILAQEAEKTGLTKEPGYKKLMDRQKEQISAEYYVEQTVDKNITDKAVHDLYDKTVANAKPAEEIKARHILVDSEDQAKEVAKQLKDGKDFAALAKEKSKDTGSAQNGGDLGWFTAEVMVPEFSKTAFALKKGEVSQPVKTQFGWHVIQLEDRRKQEAPKFDDVKERLRQQLREQATTEAIDRLRKSAKIEVKGQAAQPQLAPSK